MLRPTRTPSVGQLATTLALFAAPAVASDGWVHLPPWQADGNDGFGSSVELEGGHAFVSSLATDRVFVRRLIGAEYVPTQELSAPGGELDTWFGKRIERDGDQLFITAPHTSGSSTSEGAVHIYDLVDGQWLLADSLLAPAPFASERFGYSMAIDGDWMAVGTNESDNGYLSRVHIYRRFGDGDWSFRYTLSGFESDFMGIELELKTRANVNRADLFAGAPAATADGFGTAGAVHHYTLMAIGGIAGPDLISPTPSSGARFGCSLAFDGEQLIVGALNDGEAYFDGRTFVFDYVPNGLSATFDHSQTLVPQAYAAQSQSGSAVALAGDRLAVGAKWAAVAGQAKAGAVRIYRRDELGTWALEDLLVSMVNGEQATLGRRLAFEGNHVLASAPQWGTVNQFVQGEGAALLFSLTPQSIPGGVATTQALATATEYGNPDAALDLSIDNPPVPSEESTLTIAAGEAFAVPYLIWGTAPIDVPFLGESLLVLPSLVEVIGLLDGTGSIDRSFDIPSGAELYGAELFVQAGTIHLFPSSGDGIESSNGLRLTVGF